MAEAVDQAELTEQIRAMIRRDLKLGDDMPLDDDTVLFGGELELDSLDALLLVSSIEKEFGIKIPNESIGREIFENVGTIVAYLQGQGLGAEGNATAPSAITPDEALGLLPHAEPFRFVSRVDELEPGVRGAGAWALTGSEAFFAGHFPDRPVVPGVLLTEALAQLSGIVAFSARGAAPDRAGIAHVDVRFVSPAMPPVDVRLESTQDKAVGNLVQFTVRALAGDRVLAEGQLSLAVMD